MIINGDNCEYGFICDVNCTYCSCNLLVSEKAKINAKRTTKFRNYLNKVCRVKIKEEPVQDSNGRWYCNVDDVILYRK